MAYLQLIWSRAASKGIGTSEFFAIIIGVLLTPIAAMLVARGITDSATATMLVGMASSGSGGIAAGFYAHARAIVKTEMLKHASAIAAIQGAASSVANLATPPQNPG